MLTDKSQIPLGVNDLHPVEGDRRFYDRRLALRLGFQRAHFFRNLIERYLEAMESRNLGKVVHREPVRQGGVAREYYLTIPQALFIVARSDAKNALDVLAEITLVVGALRSGAPIPDTPWTDALFAPDRPTIERGADNVVHVRHEQQGRLFDDAPTDSRSPRIRDNSNFVEPHVDEAIVRALADTGRTPRGYGESTEEQPTMFMRDELPLGHSADSWRVWIGEQWFRLPLDLRQRWWKDTHYGSRAPSQSMIDAVIAIALP